jgi:Tfp pilus assembly protein PilN
MIISGRQKTLGLCFDDDAITIARIDTRGSDSRVIGEGAFDCEGLHGLDEPQKIGRTLGRYLAARGLKAREVVVGLPASWLLFRARKIPPTTADRMDAIVGLQAEQAFCLKLNDLVLDWCGRIDSQGPNGILVVAVLRQRLEQVQALLQAAGLKAVRILPSAMALGGHCRQQGAQAGFVLRLRRTGGELIVLGKDGVIDVRDLVLPAGGQPEGRFSPAVLASHVLRHTMGPDHQHHGPRKIMVVNDGMLSSDQVAKIKQQLIPHLEVMDEPIEGLNYPAGDNPEPSPSAAAMALVAPTQDHVELVDFVHPRYGRKVRAGRRKIVLYAVAALALVAAGAGLIWDWKNDAAETAALAQRYAHMQDDIKDAQRIVRRTTAAQGWFAQRPGHLDCLRQLAGVFPPEGSVWATNLMVAEGMRAVISGQAVDETTIVTLLEQLKKARTFDDIRLLYMRENGKGAKAVSFSIQFRINPKTAQ